MGLLAANSLVVKVGYQVGCLESNLGWQDTSVTSATAVVLRGAAAIELSWLVRGLTSERLRERKGMDQFTSGVLVEFWSKGLFVGGIQKIIAVSSFLIGSWSMVMQSKLICISGQLKICWMARLTERAFTDCVGAGAEEEAAASR